MDPKPDFERLRTALYCKEPDRVPLAELAICSEVMSAFLGKPIESLADIIEFQAKAGYDYVRCAPVFSWNPDRRTPKEGVRITRNRHSVYADDEQERGFVSEKAGIITSWEEFESHHWWTLDDIPNWDVFERARKLLPDGMKIIGQYGDIFTQVWVMMGFETFSYALVEDPGLVEAMFQKIGSLVYGMFERMVHEKDVEALWYSDDIAYTEGLMVSPAVLRQYLFPWLKKIGDLARQKGIPYIYHSDGDLWQVMEDLIGEIGFNALQPIEPKGMNINELKARVGHRVCLIGNLDLGYTLTRGTPEEVAAETRMRIREIAPGGGYCVGSSNTVPPYVPYENFRAMVETTLKYGTYPIDV